MGETCGMKLVMQTVPTGRKCKLCDKIENKRRRRAAELDRINRWQRTPSNSKAAIEKTTDMIRTLDAEISELDAERHRRLQNVPSIFETESGIMIQKLDSPKVQSTDSDNQMEIQFELGQKRDVYMGLPLTFETPFGPATVMAVPDSGSERNVISRDLALHLGLKITQTGGRDRIMSCVDGGTICSTGNVEAFCRFGRTFLSEPRRIYCVFQVLDLVISPLIMSAAFLERTETMTKYPKRLIERTFNAMQIPRVCTLGRTRRRPHCSINGQYAEVLPDTGSDVDIMSPDYMLDNGLVV
jgi:hypothetical protein